MPANDRWNDRDVLEDFGKPSYPEVEAVPGLELTHGGSRTQGEVAGFSQDDKVVLVDRDGRRHVFAAHDGAFLHKGRRVALRAPQSSPTSRPSITASGSIAAPTSERARTARAGRIWVEGFHDAELIEKVWGDDLRSVGVVVEPLHGVDDLADAVARFSPDGDRRLGILLDHLITGTKEARLADSVAGRHVLVCGHPYVDIWQAIKPATIGIGKWPTVPRGQPWKEGVIGALKLTLEPGVFWGKVLHAVDSYTDLEMPLVNAVERLIDFVTVE